MVSDSELVEQLRAVLRDSDLSTTTAASVRRRLEEHFSIDLSDRKPFIRENIDLYLESIQNEGGPEEEQEQEEEKDDDEEEDEDEEDGGAGSSNGKGAKKKRSTKPDKETKKRGGGFTKLCSLSPQLQNFVGEAELARTQVVKKMWVYIRENNLQDPSNKRKIICDEKLQELFGVKSIDMFQMNKALAKHIWPLGSTNGPTTSVVKEHAKKEKPMSKEKNRAKSKEKRTKKESESDEDEDEPQHKDKRQKGGGLLTPLPISDALVKFIGTGENELSRGDVVKRIWKYIKDNNLQDPSDKRRIICDDKLKDLFEVDSFNGFTVAKLLGAHFVKAENQ